ncbi:hypothetical protein [Bradyrhizobium semiaridum]|uniref:hypothetical protein n=1 Tax=Bradyrhizobium semiaridum TaxID=2821404 RepID=UPI001CE32B3D|nr:hypothetical protein [Bradyrhizobium semiaridum]
MGFNLIVNGDRVASTADPLTPLVDVLREELHLTGAKPVCRHRRQAEPHPSGARG